MTRTRLVSLAVITAVVVALAIYVSIRQAPQPLDAGEPLLPTLESRINDVTEVRVSSRGRNITVKKTDNGWVVVERDNWPADFGRIRENLIQLAQSRVFEPKTSNPLHYDRLGVQAHGDDTDNSAVTIIAGDEEMVTLIIGKTASTTGGSYVRLADTEQALLLHESVRPPIDTSLWIERNIIHMPPERLNRVIIDPPVQDAYVVSRNQDGEFALEKMPSDATLKPGTIRRLTSVLRDLRVNDVVARADEPDDDTVWFRATHEGKDGIIVVYETRQLEVTHYARLTVSFDPALAPDDEAARSKAEEEAAEWAARLNGRQFIVPAFRGTDVSQYWDELFEDAAQDSSE